MNCMPSPHFMQARDVEEIERDSDRDFWMTATEAKEYGLIDEVLFMNPRKEKKS
jgi:ATP-dependent Clp protease protease subunit